MKLHKLQPNGISHVIVPLFIVVAIAIGGVLMLVASHADDISEAEAYLVLDSRGGHYTKVRITPVGVNTTTHKCGGAFNGNAPITKTLKKRGLTTISCSAISAEAAYNVSYGYKGKSGVVYGEAHAVNVDNKKCTFVGPAASDIAILPFAPGTSRCPSDPLAVSQSVPKRDVVITVSAAKNKKSNGILGIVTLTETPADAVAGKANHDDSKNIVKTDCVGSIIETYRNDPDDGKSFIKRRTLKYQELSGIGYCQATIGQAKTTAVPGVFSGTADNTQGLVAGGKKYTVSAQFTGNVYLNQITSAAASVSLK